MNKILKVISVMLLVVVVLETALIVQVFRVNAYPVYGSWYLKDEIIYVEYLNLQDCMKHGADDCVKWNWFGNSVIYSGSKSDGYRPMK